MGGQEVAGAPGQAHLDIFGKSRSPLLPAPLPLGPADIPSPHPAPGPPAPLSQSRADVGPGFGHLSISGSRDGEGRCTRTWRSTCLPWDPGLPARPREGGPWPLTSLTDDKELWWWRACVPDGTAGVPRCPRI